MELTTVIYLIGMHFFADFFCQTRELADNKSKDTGILTIHVGIYSIVLGIMIKLWSGIDWEMMFVTYALLFLTHWITDYITSKITRKFYERKNYYAFFNTIAVDQVIHLVSVLYLYKILVL